MNSGTAMHCIKRGILYAPDYVINAGGLINVSLELAPNGYDRTKAFGRIADIETSLEGSVAD